MSVTSPDIIQAPVYTDTVNQNYFIESLGGSQQPTSYLDNFPDSIYTKAIDSVLVTFLYGLLGPAGVGQLQQEYLEARLETEEAGLNTVNLDAAYSNPFGFARLAEETYDIDANASILSSQERAQITSQDSTFRNRAMLYFQGIRAGGTKLGISLVAQSGLNHPVDVIENFRWLWDQFSDDPLGLVQQGTTTNMGEVVILPRQDMTQSAMQTITITGNPFSGYFTISFPASPDYTVIPIQATLGSPVIGVPDSTLTPIGTWISITGCPTTGNLPGAPNPVLYAEILSINSPTSVTIGPATGNTGSGSPLNIPASPGTGSWYAYVGTGRTTRIPYNVTALQLQSILQNIPSIGFGNVSVSGGPFPANAIEVNFTGELSSMPVPTLLMNTAPDIFSGINSTTVSGQVIQMEDATGNPLTIGYDVEVGTSGISADSDQVTISDADKHAMEVALDAIRPQTCFITTKSARSTTVRQPVNGSFAASSYSQVLTYVTGSNKVQWPAVDSTHWIQKNIENEAPRPFNGDTGHYQGFHNISNITAYADPATEDPYYQNPNKAGAPDQPFYVRFYDTKIGLYSQQQVALIPALGQYTNPKQQYVATLAEANQPTPLVVSSSNGTSLINNEYPVDYLNLPGIPPQNSNKLFWSSAERSAGIDYLEVDLGVVQAVNYLYFEATSKPYQISLSYDVQDNYPQRTFAPVTLMNQLTAPSITSIAYLNATTSPWTPVTINFTNALGGMIYTRILRIELTKNPARSAYTNPNGTVIPYSIEVRNLRAGRNVS